MKPLQWLKARVGVELDPFLGPDWHELFQQTPIAVYDVGAAGGLFSPYRRGPSEVHRLYGFEPEEEQFRRLVEQYRGQHDVELRPVALCDSDGPVTFYRCTGGLSWSSLYDRDAYGAGSETVEVEGARLDSVPRRYAFPPADFVKMDTEGNELDILCSGPDMLSSSILGLWIEIAFWRNPGEQGARFHDIDKLLYDAGFVLFDLQINRGQFSGVGGKKGKLRSGDALYLCDFATFYQRNRDRIDDAMMRTKLFKLVSLCAATRYLDYALEILDFGRRQGLVEGHEFSTLANCFAATADISDLVPGFPGRVRLAQVCDLFSSMLHRHAKKGIPPSFNRIGNDWPFTARRRRRPDVVSLDNAVFGGDAAGNKTIRLTDTDPDESQGS